MDMVDTSQNALPKIPNQVCGWRFRMESSHVKPFVEGGLRLRGTYKRSESNAPLVTIITVVYNRVCKLERAIKSVLMQTYRNIEYIVIDGASTDGTLEVIKNYEHIIDYYVSEPDQGVYNAMNKGLSLAAGDYICILNSDDWLIDDAIKYSVRELLASNADYSGADEYCVDEQGNLVFLYGLRHFDEVALVMGNPCNHGTMLISSNAYEKIGYYDETYKIAADLKMQLALITDNRMKHCIINKPIHYYELAGLSDIHKDMMLKEVAQVLREYHPSINKTELCSLVSLVFDWQFNEQIISDIENILRKPYYTQKQKYYLLNRLVECGYTIKDQEFKHLVGKTFSYHHLGTRFYTFIKKIIYYVCYKFDR
ncbi:glycosyltransferase family 2 protein [Acetonema longum]|nr:glycosyltransferase family 2 protein [Acetonema longum]